MRYLHLVCVLGLAACAAPAFDGNQYMLLAESRQVGLEASQQCGTPDAALAQTAAIKSKLALYEIYSGPLPNNENQVFVAQALQKMLVIPEGKHGRVYCESKFKDIDAGLLRMMRTTAKELN